MAFKINAQDLEISSLKARIKLLEDKDKGSAELSGDDAPIKGRSMEIREEVGVEKKTELGSNDTNEMVNVLTFMDTANILTSRVADVSVLPVVEVSTVDVPTVSGLFPTISAIFTTASVVTPYSRHTRDILAKDKGKEKMIARDAEIARIHVEEELKMMIDGLDRSNEMNAKHLHKYEQAAADLTIGEKIELINELVKYQDHHEKILKYQAQQSKPLSKKEQREFYMSVLRSHSRWKTKHFRGMTLEEIKEKFIHVWKQIEDSVPMASKKEAKRFKRKGLRLEQGSAKRMKTSEDVFEEDINEMMQLVPVEENTPYKFTWADKEVLISEGSPVIRTESQMETYKTVSQDIRDQLNAKAKAVQIILTWIDNHIYSTVDACPNACEIWKAIERVNQLMSKILKRNYIRNLENSHHIMEIDKLMALISLSFKKIYKPTNNNLRTSSNTSRANQDKSQRIGNVAGARETVGSTVMQRSGIQCYNCKEYEHVAREYQELEAHYMYMAKIQKVSPDVADSGPIFDTEPVQKVSTHDHYNVFAIESEHLEQSESVHDTYSIEQDEHHVIIDSLDMSHDREQIDQNDDDADLVNERELLASLIEKLKCEIVDSKNRNKFLETSNKVLIEKLKGEIKDFKNKNKCLESSNNRFKEANNKLSETNNLLYTDFKKSQAKLVRQNSVEYASKVEFDCVKARGDLISYKMEF
nr:hypothetical protein [Tanacetum cinerariifolium]